MNKRSNASRPALVRPRKDPNPFVEQSSTKNLTPEEISEAAEMSLLEWFFRTGNHAPLQGEESEEDFD
jgi:hypothetical protein